MRNRLRAITALSVVIAVVVVGAGSVLVKSPAERDQIDAANRISARFDTALEQYTASTASNAAGKNPKTKKDLQGLLAFVKSRLKKAPVIPTKGTTAYGRSHSHDYETAMRRQKLALKPLQSLSSYLEGEAIPAFSFANAGIKLVQVNPVKVLGPTPLYTGAPLHDLVLPAFEKARDKLKKQITPQGAELLQLDLMTYANDVIGMTKKGVKAIDAGKAFHFEFGTRPEDLYKRLIAVESAVLTELGTRVNGLTPVA